MPLAWLLLLLLTGPCDPAKNSTVLDQRLYLGVLHGGGVEGLEKVVERALSSAGPLPLPLTPLYVTSPQQQASPGGFGSSQLRYICSKLEGRHLAAILVLTKNGAEMDARMAAAVSSVPLLWFSNAPFQQEKLGRGEVRLDASAREAAWALRSLLVTSHWHSYTLLESEDLRAWGTVYKRILSGPPLSLRRVPLPKGNPSQINRVLTWVSQSTRGVIAVATDSRGVEIVMKEAKRLNMVSGDFVWIWLDTGPSIPAQQVQQTRVTRESDWTRVRRSPDVFSRRSGFDSNPEESIVDLTDGLSRPDVFPIDSASPLVSSYVYRIRSKRFADRWRRSNLTASEWPRIRRLRELPQPSPMAPIPRLPIGLLAVRRVDPTGARTERLWVRGAVRLVGDAVRRAAETTLSRLGLETISFRQMKGPASCYSQQGSSLFTSQIVKELRKGTKETLEGRMYESNESSGKTLAARFQILNLLPEGFSASVSSKQVRPPQTTKAVEESTNWRSVGEIVGCCDVRLERIVWPGGNIGGPCGGARTVVSVVTALAAPFVMASDVQDQKKPVCLRGIICRLMREYNGTRYSQKTMCCYGFAMDLLAAVAEELQFDYSLYTVPDNMFGSKVVNPDSGRTRWSGIVGDLVSGHAHLAFTALSLSRPRQEVIDFSTPFYFGGVSFLAAPNTKTDIPLLAFLLPFSPELWIAIFTSLNVTAVAVAIYEWLSPFGLNPWGRQRTKNFSMSSALWVCWGLLCGHLVAFKAPKSWPNKFLINVWGGFSVIFVASYTANIAALIAGLFFQSATATYDSEALLWQRVGAPKGSVAEQYVHKVNQLLYDHMQRYHVSDIETGVHLLRNGTLDFLIADTPILDYYRATDHGCKLQKVGDPITEDAYSVGMTKGFPLKDSISAVISKFYSNGFMDILQEKYYGGLACFKADMDVSQPKPLGVTAVAGVFLLLGLGMIMGILILLVEHLFYRYTLPILRHKPKGTIWKSRNIMFFSQKLYRFINCVELVSPHHAARELVHTIRQGQITSLFQKSVKRKEHEQRRRRKSKAQFFEMIQEIRRVQQEEKQATLTRSDIMRPSPRSGKLPRIRSPRDALSPAQERRMSRLPARLELARRLSKDVFRSKSSGNLSLRRMSSENSFGGSRFLDTFGSQAIGRRLSRDTNLSPPDINSRRASHLLSVDNCASDISHRNSANELDAARDPRLDARFNPPEISIQPPGSSATLPAKKFSYVDIQNTTFKDRISRFNDTPELSTFKHTQDSRKDEQRKFDRHSSEERKMPENRFNEELQRNSRFIESRNKDRFVEERKNFEDKALVHDRPRISATLSYDGGERERHRREDRHEKPKTFKASSLDAPERPPRSTVPTLLEQISQMQEQFPAKPKVVSCVPKRIKPEQLHFGEQLRRRYEQPSDSDSRSESGKNDGDRSPLDRLSKDELVNLCAIPENELKRRLIQAIKDKNPP